LVSFVVMNTAALAAATPQEMYLAALARERAVRAAFVAEGSDLSARTAAAARAAVRAYQEVVRVHPTSGYSDNALWQAGVLSLDLFARLGLERDKTTGIRLLRLLTSEYPTSTRVRHVPSQLARADKPSAGAAARPLPGRARPATAETGPPAGPKAPAGPNGRVALIRSITRTVLPDAVRITIELDAEVSYHDERLPNPTRVFLDLPSTRAEPALIDRTLRFDVDNDIVRQVRIGRHPDNTTRVVLDAAGVSSYSVYPMYNPYRLVIDCIREPEPTLAAAARSDPGGLPDPPVPPGPGVPTPMPAGNGPATGPMPVTPPPAARIAAAPLPAADPLPAPTATSAPPRNVGGGYSLARQLGLSVSRIVIDPGHGGHDPGATGRSISEAELVLDVALRVEKLLQSVPGTEVILTRRTDAFVPLQERTAIANREGADLFLSIHANASENPSARGVETYFLNFATNMGAASVAARENAASGQAMGALPDFLKAIALHNKLDESRDFATEVQRAIVERLRKSNRALKDLGVKQAPFVVLIGAAMPSVLAEISFVTNEQEARLLRGSAYRQRIAEALVSAIQKYQTSLKNVAVAKQ
jgi:N-acetylmuramoyl-L-alanine amidase